MTHLYSAGLEIQRSQNQIPVWKKIKISHTSNQYNTTTNPSAPEVKYLKLSEQNRDPPKSQNYQLYEQI